MVLSLTCSSSAISNTEIPSLDDSSFDKTRWERASIISSVLSSIVSGKSVPAHHFRGPAGAALPRPAGAGLPGPGLYPAGRGLPAGISPGRRPGVSY